MIFAQESDFLNAGGAPRVSGSPDPTFWEKFLGFFPDWAHAGFESLAENAGYAFLVALIFIFLHILRNKIARDRKQIEKLWTFIVFFLSKRMMMIPLVVRLSAKENVLTQDQRNTLLSIREEVQNVSLKTDPKARFEKEKTVSKILFEYFQTLESSENQTYNRSLKKVIGDLEFIDEKLVQLQVVYNREAKKWNEKMKNKFFLRNRVRPFFDFEIFDFE